MHGERTTWKKTAGILIALTGTIIVMFEHGATLASDHTRGNILIFIAVLAWSMFTILGKPLIPKYGALRVTAIHFLFGSILYLPIGLSSPGLDSIVSLPGKIWLEVIYLGVIGSCLNYISVVLCSRKIRDKQSCHFPKFSAYHHDGSCPSTRNNFLNPCPCRRRAACIGRCIAGGKRIGAGVRFWVLGVRCDGMHLSLTPNI